jgi:hypothetical protein
MIPTFNNYIFLLKNLPCPITGHMKIVGAERSDLSTHPERQIKPEFKKSSLLYC